MRGHVGGGGGGGGEECRNGAKNKVALVKVTCNDCSCLVQ